MCLGVPRRVLSIDEALGMAEVEVAGDRQRVSIAMLRTGEEPVRPGEWLIVHMGFALDTIGEVEATEVLRQMATLEDPEAWFAPVGDERATPPASAEAPDR